MHSDSPSPNPYQAPRSDITPAVDDPKEYARRRLAAPAFLLIVHGSLQLALGCFMPFPFLLAFLMQFGTGFIGGDIWAMVFWELAMMAVYLVVIFGADNMRTLRRWRVARTAALLALVPCSICFTLGVPLGIWSLVVLYDPRVRDAFEVK